MTTEAAAPPTQDEIDALKRLAAGIIRAQGNRFIKELLRHEGIRIGVNKDEFEANLNAAIEQGDLRIEAVQAWLERVEGWGNQHVYLYNITPALRRELTGPRIRERVQADPELQAVWEGSTVLEFPDDPQLTSVSFADGVLRLIWQEASPGWTPVPDRDYQQVEGLDLYEFRAWRMVERRAITRFEAHLGLGLAAVFIANPIQGDEHAMALAEVRRVVALLMDLARLERGQVDVSTVSRNVDQGNVPGPDDAEVAVKTQKSRLTSGGAYVEFAATSKDKAYWEEPAIEDVRITIQDEELLAFQGTGGVFVFQPDPAGLERPLRVQLYGRDDRIRLWAQMEASEVWTVLKRLSAYQ